ncbi:XrtA system polysaccharide chain length determinant [Thalassotalea sp. ND16A]|uniref:XrtA system polysaccharide chain length determinant n=1 Tax=Thalassotalea sp. ND16A TaxID=1535422 RepID=UPI000519FD0C|nr:XrtA system polysaccharide chain length determinant [Thalassotalea sp. ND16A]KGJ95966.1 hypothetical protein ND16A_1145 [Thalassotalea sp. ND16A]
MHDQIVIIKELLLGVWSKKHYIILSTWLICPVSWFGIAHLPDVYESEARVYVDTQSLLRPLMKGLMVETDPNVEIRLIISTLLRRANLERIVRMTDLDIQANDNEEFEEIIEELKENIKISSAGRVNIFTLAAVAENPQLAKNIVQAALTVFIENTLGETREDTNSAHKFIEQQIAEYEDRLKADETRLKEFKQEFYSSLPGNSQNYSKHLANEKAKLKEAELSLLEAKTRFESAQAQLKGKEPVFDNYSQTAQENNSITTQLDSRISQLQERLDGLLLRFTTRHPDVKEVQRRLNQLNTIRKDKIDKYMSASQANPQAFSALDGNPVYQKMRIQANQLENEVASLTVRVNDYRERVQQIEQQIFSIPEVDAEFMALNRGYKITKNRYEELLKRQENAQLAKDAEKSTEKIQFKVIDPPKLPLDASGPYRTAYLIGTFFLSILIGAAAAFFINQITPKVFSTSQLMRNISLPIFGVVSATKSLGTINSLKRKNMLFIVSHIFLIMLLIAFIAYFQLPDLIQPQLKRFF